MKTIIIDTNALMSISEVGIDLFTEIEKVCDFPYKIAVLEGTIKELEKIEEEQRAKFSRAATLTLRLLKAKKVEIIEHPTEYVDHILVELSEAGDLILTQDAALKKRLTRPFLTIRQGKMVVMVK